MPSPIDLTTVATLASIGFPNTNPTDTQFIITASSQMVASYLGFPIHRREDVEEFPASWGGGTIHLKSSLVQSITSIEVDGQVVDPSNYRLASPTGRIVARGGYLFPFTGVGTGGIESTPYQALETGRIKVTFDAGFITPGQVALSLYPASDMPSDLEQVVIEVCQALSRSRDGSSTIASESLGNASVSYGADRSQAISTTVKAMLAAYKTIRIPV